jgi:hypothetical protein
MITPLILGPKHTNKAAAPQAIMTSPRMTEAAPNVKGTASIHFISSVR